LFTKAVEQLRAFAASVDGSLLDDRAWGERHRRILQVSWLLALFTVVFTIVDHERRDQGSYAAAVVLFSVAATFPQFGRRTRENCVALVFMLEQIYLLRYVGNFMLGPLAMIILTFYQDWVPIAVGCVVTVLLVVIAWVDAAYFNGARGFAVEAPQTGMTLRAAAIIVAAALALAIWRSGTQFARDQLTGMLSRAGAERALDHELARGRRPAVWVCDVDNFRTVNQHLGREAGDLLLKRVGSKLLSVANVQSGAWICARLGADTFMVAGRHVADDDFIADFAYGLEREAGLSELAVTGDEVPVRFSVGAAAGIADERGAGLIRAAERNMREAKGRGFRRVVVDQRIDRGLGFTPLLTASLYSACERGELEVYLQPVVQLSDGAPVGAEALVRWNHPERGLMLPGEFLPDAEKDSALMAVVSQTVARQLLETVVAFRARHGSEWLSHGYAYNLAAVRLRDPLLVRGINAMLNESGLKTTDGILQLEITEGALMDAEHGALDVLAELAANGYRIALDDFGTGHSSLAHLRDFPLDTVKIDRAFVQSMDRSPIDRAVVQAVADIASASGLKVVAEGVETAEQREILLTIKPDLLAQGWLYAKAMPVDEFEAWVLDRKQAMASAQPAGQVR
jgi:diguanylate cyclase (GGDEF)-like protein